MKPALARLWRFLHLPKNMQLLIMRGIQDQFLVGVTGIIFDDQQEVLLFKHSYRQTVWSLPGGYLKSREHPREGLEREIKEESGLVVSVDQQLKTRTDRDTARLDICYVGKFIGGEFTPSHEVTEHGFFSFENLPLISTNQLKLVELALNQDKSLPKDIANKVDSPRSLASKVKSLFTI